MLAWLVPEKPLRETVLSSGMGESFAAPKPADSLREIARALSKLAGRDRTRQFIESVAAETGVGRRGVSTSSVAELTIPLQEARLGESQVDGDFTIFDNELRVDADLPPLKQIKGKLHFTAKELRFADVSARLFGGPLKISGGTSGGKLAITADGTFSADELRRQSDMPLLKQLSGHSAYRAELRMRKLGDVQWVVNSNLLDLASALPAPFNKAAADALPLHLEISPLPSTSRATAGREQVLASLGQIASLQLITRKKGPESLPERGVLMIGRPLTPLPERGVAIGISAKVFDVDTWRGMLPASGKDGEFPMSLDLKADELILLGKYYNDVSLAVWGLAPHWRGMIQSRDANGAFQKMAPTRQGKLGRANRRRAQGTASARRGGRRFRCRRAAIRSPGSAGAQRGQSLASQQSGHR